MAPTYLILNQSLDLLPVPFGFFATLLIILSLNGSHKCYHVKVTPNPRHAMLECMKMTMHCRIFRKFRNQSERERARERAGNFH
jgi:hypothetical protein